MAFKRWLYKGGRPNWLARALNAGWAAVHATGVLPNYLVTLEVVGRRSGDAMRLPLVMVSMGGERYLVSMLGPEANWVRNVEAAGGKAMLRHGKAERVRLEPVAVEARAPILRQYLQIAPGARPHVAVDKDAPLAAFAQVADAYPVFRVVDDQIAQGATDG